MPSLAGLGKPSLGGEKPVREDSVLPRIRPGGRQISHFRTANTPLTAKPRLVSRIASNAESLVSETVTASVPAPNDPVVSALFTLAVAALSVVTIGVSHCFI